MRQESFTEREGHPFLKSVSKNPRPWVEYTRRCSPPAILQFADAEDVLANSLLKALTKLDSFRGDRIEQLRAWFERIIRNKTVTWLRAQRKRRIILIEELCWVPHIHARALAVSPEIRELVERATERLPENQRILFQQVCVLQRCVSEVADEHQLSREGASSMLYRARKSVGAFLVDRGVTWRRGAPVHRDSTRPTSPDDR